MPSQKRRPSHERVNHVPSTAAKPWSVEPSVSTTTSSPAWHGSGASSGHGAWSTSAAPGPPHRMFSSPAHGSEHASGLAAPWRP